jgi:hypothetical protein
VQSAYGKQDGHVESRGYEDFERDKGAQCHELHHGRRCNGSGGCIREFEGCGECHEDRDKNAQTCSEGPGNLRRDVTLD